MATAPRSHFQRLLPGLSLMVLAPLVAELLPGATPLRAIFVLPIQVAIWGGGAVMIREAVRRWNLGWLNLLLLAMALAVAEECLIQQTSLAPVVVKLKNEEYARAYGVNYVYLVWALIYEAAFVVFIPIGLAELIFIRRRDQPWLSATGAAIIAALFVPACFLAWFTWTHIARTQVFHLPAYTPPAGHVAIAALIVVALVAAALGPARTRLAQPPSALRPLHPLVLALLGGAATVVVFGLEVLAFGIAPRFPPLLAVAIGLVLAMLLLVLVPRFHAHRAWGIRHDFGILYGAILTNLAVFFVAFIGSTPLDFYGKVVLDAVATLLLIRLAMARLSAPAP